MNATCIHTIVIKTLTVLTHLVHSIVHVVMDIVVMDETAQVREGFGKTYNNKTKIRQRNLQQ